MRAAIYTRISKDLREGAGVARQEKVCREHCEKKGYDVLEVLQDNDISAFSGKARPGFDRMLELIKKGAIDVVVTWHTDRLYRRLSDLEELIKACNEKSTPIETVDSGDIDLSTAQGRMQASIGATFSKFEVDHQIERQRATHADRAARGRYRGGPVTFGFKTIPGKPGYLEHEPKEAEALRFAVDEVLAGNSLRFISRKWVEMGVAVESEYAPGGSAKVRKRLSSPRIAGLEPYKGKVYPATTYEAIIPEDKWRAVLNVLASNKATHTRGPERQHLGSGIFRCGRCEHRLNTIKRTRRGEDTRAYRCPNCAKLSRKITNVDEVVVTAVLGYLDREDNRVTLARKDTDEGESLQVLLDKQRGIEARQAEFAGMFAEGEVTADQLRVANKRFTQQLEVLEQRIRNAGDSSPLTHLLLAGDDLRAGWEALSRYQQAQVVDELVTVTIMPTKPGKFDPTAIKFEWKV